MVSVSNTQRTGLRGITLKVTVTWYLWEPNANVSKSREEERTLVPGRVFLPLPCSYLAKPPPELGKTAPGDTDRNTGN